MINSVKVIPFERKDFKLIPENKHNRFTVKLDGEYETYMDIRVSMKDNNNFSVLLRYKGTSGSSYIITRYNGFHGNHANPDGNIISGCHIHRITEEAQRNGLKKKLMQSLQPSIRRGKRQQKCLCQICTYVSKGKKTIQNWSGSRDWKFRTDDRRDKTFDV